MKSVKDPINKTALAIENAQGDIRVLIKNAFLYRYSRQKTENDLKAIIDNAVKGINIPRLKRDTQISLLNFANQQRLLWQNSGFTPELLLFLSKGTATYPPKGVSRVMERITGVNPQSVDKGVPLQRYYANVWKDKVKPTLDNLVKVKALDPTDYSGRNSLRNLAEMEVRYKAHIDEISDLKKDGVKIVACSSHADCSERCAPWQGRLYSLDGSTGEINGIKYVPLEKATDHYYTTKAGRVYKNGLLGFNCRHYLREYSGKLLPTVSAEERKKEYAITQEQRRLERAVRQAKTTALMNKGINRSEYLKARNQAINLYEQYKTFSKKNNRAFYPMRTDI